MIQKFLVFVRLEFSVWF